MDFLLTPGQKTSFNPDWERKIKPVEAFATKLDDRFRQPGYQVATNFAPYLDATLREAAKQLETTADYPSIFWLVAIGMEHDITHVGYRIEPNIVEKCGPRPSCRPIDPAGVTFDFVTQMADNATMELDGSPVSAGTEFEGQVATAYKFHAERTDVMVPTGKTMLLGIRFLTPPSAGAATLSGLVSRITPFIRAVSFDHSIQTGI